MKCMRDIITLRTFHNLNGYHKMHNIKLISHIQQFFGWFNRISRIVLKGTYSICTQKDQNLGFQTLNVTMVGISYCHAKAK